MEPKPEKRDVQKLLINFLKENKIGLEAVLQYPKEVEASINQREKMLVEAIVNTYLTTGFKVNDLENPENPEIPKQEKKKPKQ